MSRHLTIALVIVLATLGPSVSYADGLPASFVGCPAGQAIRGINFVTRSLVCVPIPNVAALQQQVAALQNTLATAQATIACMRTVGTDVFFEGCNVHVLSGGGATDAPINGLGNLIIGYNEDVDPFFGEPAVRTGSHNLVVGPVHTYSSFGGLVAGRQNAVTGAYATVSGGQLNTASGFSASVSGGHGNTASLGSASVSGGNFNTASGFVSSVSGGEGNTASGRTASVSGGLNRSATGDDDWVAGGLFQDF